MRAGHSVSLGRYVDYYGKYATSHYALDRDTGLQEEVKNGAQVLANELTLQQKGRPGPDDSLEEPQPKDGLEAGSVTTA